MKFKDLLSEGLNTKQLIDTLKEMDIPEVKLKNMDIEWMIKNLEKKNNKHPKIKEVMDLLKKMV